VDAKLQRFFEDTFRPFRYDPSAFSREILATDPHDGQVKWLTSSQFPENALTTGNQYGKSTVAAVKSIWNCVFEKGWTAEIRAIAGRSNADYQAMNVAFTFDQAKIVWEKALALLQGNKASWMISDVKMTPFPTITFFNGATLTARSTANRGARLLGKTLDFINWDEAAYDPDFLHILNNVFRMRLVARRGKLDFTTTGNGRNDYGEYFLSGLPGEKLFGEGKLYSQAGSSYENTHLPVDNLDRLAEGLGDRFRRQNIGGEIIDAGGGYFDIEHLQAALCERLTGQLRTNELDKADRIAWAEVVVGYNSDPDRGSLDEGMLWVNSFPDHRYVHFWDLARVKDWVVGITLDTSGEKLALVEYERFNQTSWAHIYDRIRLRHKKYGIGGDDEYNNSRTIVDSTGVGDTAVEALSDINAEGFKFTASSKPEILAGLQEALSLRQLDMPMITVLFDELKFYELDDKKLVQDTVMALAGAVHFGRRQPYIGVGFF
jgi:hypothetical protein